MSYWQPIETAPRDVAVSVDVWTSYDERVTDVRWNPSRQRWEHWHLGDFDAMDWVKVDGTPTHGWNSWSDEARAIVALLPEPVDPDIELVDEVMFARGWDRDDSLFRDVHIVAFDCLKRGRALAVGDQ